MSRFVVLIRPALATGFQLAGVETIPARDLGQVERQVEEWLESHENILLALDDSCLEAMSEELIRRMDAAPNFLYVAIHGGPTTEPRFSRPERIARVLQQAIGFSITFQEEDIEPE
jgi:vacuolar-type H+-ATPase subunit F/Vma7